MVKRQTSPIPVEDHRRCTRIDGKNWRCSKSRFKNSVYCHKHHFSYIAKTSNPRNTPAIIKNYKPAPLIEPTQIWSFTRNPSQTIPEYCLIAKKTNKDSTFYITELIPHPILEEEVRWVDEYKNIMSCGTFRVSKKKPVSKVDVESLLFRVVGSKMLRWMKMRFYRIFPNKGEVWVVRNYEDEGRKKVEILTAFSEEEGVDVCFLVDEGDGFYERQMVEGCRLERSYGRKEMVLFEKRVLAEKVDGGESDQRKWKVILD